MIIESEDEEQDVFQAIVYSRLLRTLVWSNTTPPAETAANVLDMRPLLSAIGVSLTHLDLSGHRLDIPSNRRALIDKLPRLSSLTHLDLRHMTFNVHGSGDLDGPQQFPEGGTRELMQTIALCNLSFLDLSGNQVGLGGCRVLMQNVCGGKLANLRTLRLRAAHLDDTCAGPLSKLLMQLTSNSIKLDVAHNDFSYYGIR